MPDCTDLLAIDCAGRAASHAAAIAQRELGRGILSLKAIAWIAPLLGTFGTALGVINALTLYWMTGFDRGETAGGPADALVVLVISLPVAILACGGFHYLCHQFETFDFEMRTAILDLLNSLARVRRGGR